MGVGFHVQPGGRSKDPLPENIENLPKGYYAQQIFALAKKPWLIRRMVDNEFGPVRTVSRFSPSTTTRSIARRRSSSRSRREAADLGRRRRHAGGRDPPAQPGERADPRPRRGRDFRR
jgi:hypothetical protein